MRTFESKFGLGDKVWYIKVCYSATGRTFICAKGTVLSVEFCAGRKFPLYAFLENPIDLWIETDLFETEEECLREIKRRQQIESNVFV